MNKFVDQRSVWLRLLDTLCYVVFTGGLLLWILSFTQLLSPVVPEHIWCVLEPHGLRGLWLAVGAAFVARVVSLVTGQPMLFLRQY